MVSESDKLVGLIQDNAHELTSRLMKDLLSREETKTYASLPEKEVYKRAYEVYSKLGSWLHRDMSKDELKRHYTALGRTRFRENVPLEELVMALMLIKRHLWLYILEAQFFNSTFEIYQSLELNNSVVLFFDRAIYYSVMGFMEEMHAGIAEQREEDREHYREIYSMKKRRWGLFQRGKDRHDTPARKHT